MGRRGYVVKVTRSTWGSVGMDVERLETRLKFAFYKEWNNEKIDYQPKYGQVYRDKEGDYWMHLDTQENAQDVIDGGYGLIYKHLGDIPTFYDSRGHCCVKDVTYIAYAELDKLT